MRRYEPLVVRAARYGVAPVQQASSAALRHAHRTVQIFDCLISLRQGGRRCLPEIFLASAMPVSSTIAVRGGPLAARLPEPVGDASGKLPPLMRREHDEGHAGSASARRSAAVRS